MGRIPISKFDACIDLEYEDGAFVGWKSMTSLDEEKKMEACMDFLVKTMVENDPGKTIELLKKHLKNSSLYEEALEIAKKIDSKESFEKAIKYTAIENAEFFFREASVNYWVKLVGEKEIVYQVSGESMELFSQFFENIKKKNLDFGIYSTFRREECEEK